MYVIAGLGNPGRKYEMTRHNAGFLAMDRISENTGIKISKIKFKSLIGEGFISGQKVILVKPQTFMNSSGEAIREIVDYYGVEMDKLVIIYDDADIPAGSLRIRKKGSAGTHNGMRSIIYQLMDDSFTRIRIGIGDERNKDIMNFVLGNFSSDEIPLLRDAIENTSLAVDTIISDGVDKAMNRYNSIRKND